MTSLGPASKTRILVVEDEKSIAMAMEYNLEKRGYVVELAARGDQGLELGLAKLYDLIILDVMLPGVDGFKICEKLREAQVRTPILMLTARGETENRIKGIRLGADDYLGKPFHLEELLARVEALLRRRDWDRAPESPHLTYRLGDFIDFDPGNLLLQCDDDRVTLTLIESKLLQLLVNEQGRAVPRAQILKKVWGLHEDTQTRTLDNFVMRLRQHLESLGGSADWIESVRGVGYRFSTTFTVL